ncbi:MAG: M20/M25/M40 family metallo-hydrolase [Chloroflexota bacterium]
MQATRAQLNLLKRLTEAVGVSGDEGAVRALVRCEIEGHADRIEVDPLGNVLAFRSGKGPGRPRVMVAAHMDEVGMMIVGADAEGLLRFEAVGGLAVSHLAGKPVWLGQERVPGVIGMPPVHLVGREAESREIGLDELRIDIGAETKEAALERVRPGTWATFATPFTRLGPTLRAKALDDRLGVAVLIELVRQPPEDIDLLAVFTVQEELGARGARAAAFHLDPDLAIALDATPARDLPTWDGEENTQYNSRVGAGPAIYVADRATISDPRLLELFQATAREEGIPYQLRQPGGGGTDAGAIHRSRLGVPSISVSVPVRYAHSPASIASVSDWRATARLAWAALSRLGGAFGSHSK